LTFGLLHSIHCAKCSQFLIFIINFWSKNQFYFPWLIFFHECENKKKLLSTSSLYFSKYTSILLMFHSILFLILPKTFQKSLMSITLKHFFENSKNNSSPKDTITISRYTRYIRVNALVELHFKSQKYVF